MTDDGPRFTVLSPNLPRTREPPKHPRCTGSTTAYARTYLLTEDLAGSQQKKGGGSQASTGPGANLGSTPARDAHTPRCFASQLGAPADR
ncbi:hypothetical protein NDU88_002238 [Pleurodeles waltl]|uniref:Uncharacterized protein n=1 Tax=Pleurodeles waltl TaxID=8319 RepID=A0AAV7NLF7_PLEWA|nr:hypothetical protein NDU88_002238 [Pleurodeles waltl]